MACSRTAGLSRASGRISVSNGSSWAGHHSEAKLLGRLQVSALHNVVHLLFGVAGLMMARAARTARWFLIGGGVIYLVLWIYGLVIDMTSAANFVPVNTADNWLHFGLGIGMIGLGLLATKIGPPATTDATSPHTGCTLPASLPFGLSPSRRKDGERPKFVIGPPYACFAPCCPGKDTVTES